MLSVPREGRSASWSRGGDGANTSWALLCLGLILCRLILTLTNWMLWHSYSHYMYEETETPRGHGNCSMVLFRWSGVWLEVLKEVLE